MNTAVLDQKLSHICSISGFNNSFRKNIVQKKVIEEIFIVRKGLVNISTPVVKNNPRYDAFSIKIFYFEEFDKILRRMDIKKKTWKNYIFYH